MEAGKDIFGNIPTDVQGNPLDKDIQDNRPKDVEGNETGMFTET